MEIGKWEVESGNWKMDDRALKGRLLGLEAGR